MKTLTELFKSTLDWKKLQSTGRDHLLENNKEAINVWQEFCAAVTKMPPHQKMSLNSTEKLWLMRTVLLYLEKDGENAKLALQLPNLSMYLKTLFGSKAIRILFVSSSYVDSELKFQWLSTICQLLMDLKDSAGILDEVAKLASEPSKLYVRVSEMHDEYIKSKDNVRNIDDLLTFFSTSQYVEFPIPKEEMEAIRPEFLQVREHLEKLRQAPDEALKQEVDKASDNKTKLVAIILETIRRHKKICVYDTQIVSLLALINYPKNLKGRIAQIKTGEGKSSIIAMLSAYMGATGNFVDVVTSSDYLAVRDSIEFEGFYNALGLSASHICVPQPDKSHFKGQIIYGTSTDFEFAYLREGLYNEKLRFSYKKGKLVPRTFDVCINDETDSLFLDMARNAALLSIPDDTNLAWVYEHILDYVKKLEVETFNRKTAREYVARLRDHLLAIGRGKYIEEVKMFSDLRLEFWLSSAYSAINYREEGRHYVVKPVLTPTIEGMKYQEDIVIVDYANTGRMSEGSQWGHGLHQFLQTKHKLKISPESLTGASLAHPTYFQLYKVLLGLTGTMGENVERDEVKALYKVDTIDVPPHRGGERKRLSSYIAGSKDGHYKKLLAELTEMKASDRPSLVLFETIKDSENFHQFLERNHIKHQLINTNQQESETYLVSRAGEAGMITIATNAAGRGTDIILAPKSLDAGGLHVIFSFYPDNSRVEGQGFGRSQRQGQPGSCQMILSMEDPRVQLLLERASIAKSLEQISTIISQIKERNDAVLADKFVEFLDKLRSERIRQESSERKDCAILEGKFFKKLQWFFNTNESIYALMSFVDTAKIFKDKILAETSVGISPQNVLIDSGWQDLVHEIANLQREAQGGVEVDAAVVYERFKLKYLQSIQKIWARFYSDLHDQLATNNLALADEKITEITEKHHNMFNTCLINIKESLLAHFEYLSQEAQFLRTGLRKNAILSAGFSIFVPKQSANSLMLEEDIRAFEVKLNHMRKEHAVHERICKQIQEEIVRYKLIEKSITIKLPTSNKVRLRLEKMKLEATKKREHMVLTSNLSGDLIAAELKHDIELAESVKKQIEKAELAYKDEVAKINELYEYNTKLLQDFAELKAKLTKANSAYSVNFDKCKQLQEKIEALSETITNLKDTEAVQNTQLY